MFSENSLLALSSIRWRRGSAGGFAALGKRRTPNSANLGFRRRVAPKNGETKPRPFPNFCRALANQLVNPISRGAPCPGVHPSNRVLRLNSACIFDCGLRCSAYASPARKFARCTKCGRRVCHDALERGADGGRALIAASLASTPTTLPHLLAAALRLPPSPGSPPA